MVTLSLACGLCIRWKSINYLASKQFPTCNLILSIRDISEYIFLFTLNTCSSYLKYLKGVAEQFQKIEKKNKRYYSLSFSLSLERKL